MSDFENKDLSTCAPEDCSSCSADCGSRLDLEKRYIDLTTDEGFEMHCEIMKNFSMGGRDYVALMPTENNPDGDIYLYRLAKDGRALENIEDEEEHGKAAEAFGWAMVE